VAAADYRLATVLQIIYNSNQRSLRVFVMVRGGQVDRRFVAYLRVSTVGQGRSGLGLEGQREAVERHVASVGGRIVQEFVEVESGRKNDRIKLAEAMTACRKHHAVLLIAKLDRLSRNAAFLLTLHDAGVEFVAADMPTANRLTVGIMALVAEEEARAISARTKAALAAAKARGVKLGGKRENAGDLRPYAKDGAKVSALARARQADLNAANLALAVHEIEASGATTLAAIAEGLNVRQIGTTRGMKWSPTQVARLKARLGKAG
jgi:DNA invertase Pin-like site-specific DNA recombinase